MIPDVTTLEWHQMTALSWRVMSELARRDPELYIAAITDDGKGNSPLTFVFMMRCGKVEFQARRGGGGFFIDGESRMITWARAFQLQSARAIASEMLGTRGGASSAVPVTQPRALGYRVMATMLELTLGDKEPWTVVWETRNGGLSSRGIHPYENSCWSLIQAGRVVATFDNFGQMRRTGGSGDVIGLMPRYIAHNRRMLPLVAELFGDSIK